MSKHYMDYKKVEGCNYYISTADTFDMGWETMVFICNGFNEVASWKEQYRKNYSNEEKAIEGHKHTVENLEECLRYWRKR